MALTPNDLGWRTYAGNGPASVSVSTVAGGVGAASGAGAAAGASGAGAGAAAAAPPAPAALAGPVLSHVLGPGGLRLGLRRELGLGEFEGTDVVAFGVVGVLAERLPVLLGHLATLGGLLDRQADPRPLQVDVNDLDPQFLAGCNHLLGAVDVVH